uniref:Uncharacterized protein n=1 Tax=Rhizophora mucronata TaxID=61149 RepID=A0A2P2QIB2_RHIMU
MNKIYTHTKVSTEIL